MSGSTKPAGPSVEILAPVGIREPGPLLAERRGSPVTSLVDRLAGELVLRFVGGRRVLDLGHGSPTVTEWVSRRAGSMSVVDAIDLGRGDRIRLPFAEASFDVVFCLRTLAHLGHDDRSSDAAARSALDEIARVLTPGGTALLQFDNALSLWGLYHGIKNPATAVEKGPLVLEGPGGLTRFDTVRRLKRMLPAPLSLQSVHAQRVLVTLPQTLQVPGLGHLIERLEWFVRDLPVIRRLGAHVVLVVRRVTDGTPPG